MKTTVQYTSNRGVLATQQRADRPWDNTQHNAKTKRSVCGFDHPPHLAPMLRVRMTISLLPFCVFYVMSPADLYTFLLNLFSFYASNFVQNRKSYILFPIFSPPTLHRHSPSLPTEIHH
jgi:hypothetical protein